MSLSNFQEKVFSSSHVEEGTAFVKSDKGKYILKLVKKYNKNSKKLNIVDIGCNDGGYTDFLRKNGHDATGLDLPAVAKNAKKKYPKSKFKGCDLGEKFPIKSNSVDMIVASEIIEHIYDDKKFLSECHRILKKGGVMILTTPNKFYFVYRFLVFFGIEWENPFTEIDTHIHFYSFQKMRFFLKKMKFNILHESGFYFEDSKLKAIERFFPKSFKMTMIFVSTKK